MPALAPAATLLLQELAQPGPLVSVEVRPPRSHLREAEGMSAWIDLHHSLGRLTREGLFVFLTDNAVGAAEEESLAHVGANVGDSVDLRRLVPILTCQHSLDYCLMFATRASSEGFEALTVLGGDRSVGAPRCLPHGRDLREALRPRIPHMALGGWVNPHRSPEKQLDYLRAPDAHNDFALSQIVSHHSLEAVERFLELSDRARLQVPVVFGVFYYRSPRASTLTALSDFFPVPAQELTAEFERGDTAEEICARTVRKLRAVGADKIYLSNLGNRGAGRTLSRILELV